MNEEIGVDLNPFGVESKSEKKANVAKHLSAISPMMNTVRLSVIVIAVVYLSSGNVIPDGSDSRQLALPANYVNYLTGNIPCECKTGVCKCCLKVVGMNGCAELVYVPQEFSFEMRMKFNDRVLMKRKISGKNPPPICFTPPRYGVGQACITFHEIYFFGRNMHVCLNFEVNFADFELLNRWVLFNW